MKFSRYYISYCIILASIAFCNAQSTPPQIQWQQCFGGSVLDVARSLQVTPDHGFIFAGFSASSDGDLTFNHGKDDDWVVKCDSNGAIQWQRSYGGSAKDWGRYIDFAFNKGYAVIGNSESKDGDVTNNHGDDDYWMLKLDSVGNLQFQKSLGGSKMDLGYRVHQTPDSGFIAFGAVLSNDGQVTGNHGDVDYWAVKLDAAGNIVWQKTYGGSNHEEGSSLDITRDGGYIMTGFSNSTDFDVTGNHGDFDVWIVKTDAGGNVQWEQSYGGSMEDGARDTKQTADGGYIVTGYSFSSDGEVSVNRGNSDIWLIKLDSLGKIQWQRTYGGSGQDYSYSVNLDRDGNYLVTGFTSSNDGDITTNRGGSDIWVLKLSKVNGDIIWQETLGGSENDEGRAFSQTASGDYLVAGFTQSNDDDVSGMHGLQDAWVVKLCTPKIFYVDADSDGYGSPSDSESVCGSVAPSGYASNNLDCNDSNALIHPGSKELCNSVDDNCNGIIDDNVIPAVITASGATSFCEPGSVRMTATPNTSRYKFQWLKDGNPIEGATNSTYIANESGNFTASISKGQCSSISNEVVITVYPTPVASILPYGTVSVCKGIEIAFTATAASGYSYQWFKDNIIVSGATASTYITGKKDHGAYYVVITNETGCSASSSPTLLNRLDDPKAKITPQGDLNICTTMQVVLQAKRGDGYFFQWRLNKNNIPGATKRNYSASITGDYTVKVTNANNCSKTSSPVTVYSSCKKTNAEEMSSPEIFIYPNPNTGAFTLSALHLPSSVAVLKIINVMGQIILEEKLNVEDGMIERKMDFAQSMQDGFYFIQIQCGDLWMTKSVMVGK